MMTSVRRAARFVKLHGSWLEESRIISSTSDILSSSVTGRTGTCNLKHLIRSGCVVTKELYYTLSVGKRLFLGNCGNCSEAGAGREHENDEVESGFSNLARCATIERVEQPNAVEVAGKELLPEVEFLDDDDKLASSDDPKNINTALELLNSIIRAPTCGVCGLLNKWNEKGNKLSKEGIFLILDGLKKRRMHWRAFQFSEWLETSKQIDLSEDYYALRINCIFNAQSLREVEKFFNKIPEPSKGELVYRNLLKSCVHALNMMKAEAVFEKMRELDLPITVEACNLMIILYKRVDRKRIANILSTMQAQNVKPSLLTYKLLIDSKGSSKDIMGMDHVVESMKADGIEPDIHVLAVMAQHYISGGFKYKAETVLKRIEEQKQQGIREARRLLLILYASIGRDDKVGEIWRECELEHTIEESVVAIEAWGKLGKIEEAEAIFDMLDQKQQLTSRLFSLLLKVYVDNKLLTKGKDLAKRMVNDGYWISPLTLDSLIRLHIEGGEIKKADEMLHKACCWKKGRPFLRTHMAVMEQYARCGDIHHTEKWFQRMKASGYFGRLKPFEVLIQAYINAKTPAYGFLDRMKAQKIWPNAAFAEQLAQVDPFQKNAIADILD